MKEELCKEFCDQILVRDVPVGLAIGTQYVGIDGDFIGFYVIGPDMNGHFHIEDSGTTIPILEACGADVSLESRAIIFRELLSEYEVEYDEDRSELKTRALNKAEIPKAALRFVALLLRLQDLTFLTKERAESTFKQEVIRDVIAEIGKRAKVTLDDIVSQALSDFRADIVIRSIDRPPVAIFLVRDSSRMYEAMLLDSEAKSKARTECRVVALMENENSVSKKVLGQAMNRIIPLHYRGDEQIAISRIGSESLGLLGETRH